MFISNKRAHVWCTVMRSSLLAVLYSVLLAAETPALVVLSDGRKLDGLYNDSTGLILLFPEVKFGITIDKTKIQSIEDSAYELVDTKYMSKIDAKKIRGGMVKHQGAWISRADYDKIAKAEADKRSAEEEERKRVAAASKAAAELEAAAKARLIPANVDRMIRAAWPKAAPSTRDLATRFRKIKPRGELETTGEFDARVRDIFPTWRQPFCGTPEEVLWVEESVGASSYKPDTSILRVIPTSAYDRKVISTKVSQFTNAMGASWSGITEEIDMVSFRFRPYVFGSVDIPINREAIAPPAKVTLRYAFCLEDSEFENSLVDHRATPAEPKSVSGTSFEVTCHILAVGLANSDGTMVRLVVLEPKHFSLDRNSTEP